MTRAASEMNALKLSSILQQRMAIPLYSLSFPNKFSIRGHHLLAQASGISVESEPVKLTVFSLIGQVLCFHIGACVFSRRTGPQDIGPAEIEKITKQLLPNLDAVLAAKEA